METILKLDQVNTFYGKSHILQGITLEVRENEILCLLGRNGVGKTTTLKSIMGLIPQRRGTLLFHGKDISQLDNYLIPRLGIGYVPQRRHIFSDLTVRENLKIGIVTKDTRQKSYEEIFNYFPLLAERLNQLGGTLSGGGQARAGNGRGPGPAP